MRRHAVGLVLVLTLALVGAGAACAAEYDAREIGVRFPDRLGALERRGELHRYPQPGLGYSLRYAGANISVDIYVYNADQRGIGSGIAGEAVVRQFAQSEREMQAYYQQQRQAARRASGGPATLGTAPGQMQWLVARYEVQQGGRALTSVVMVTGYRDYFIKVRATFPAAGKDSDPLAPFANELSTLLAASLQTPPGPQGTPGGAPGK